MGPKDPEEGGSNEPTGGPEKKISDAAPPESTDTPRASPVSVSHLAAVSQVPETISVPDAVLATQIGGQLGAKARRVVAYLNSIRALDRESYTVPVGYGQISYAAQVDLDYLRRKVLPKLAMLGLIAIARKTMEGTIYQLRQSEEYLRFVASEVLDTSQDEHPKAPSANFRGTESTPPSAPVDSLPSPTEAELLPAWIDREAWGWLSVQSVRRLIEKAGSEEAAQEKLAMLLYNETHGPPEQRVRNRRSVLAHYISSPKAELWPNDNGFETLAVRKARIERDQAQQEKALAEEAYRLRREAEQVKFQASLTEQQLSWIKQEARRLVDKRPDAKFLTSRYPLYKAEEERLLAEWMDRVSYGETIPSAE